MEKAELILCQSERREECFFLEAVMYARSLCHLKPIQHRALPSLLLRVNLIKWL